MDEEFDFRHTVYPYIKQIFCIPNEAANYGLLNMIDIFYCTREWCYTEYKLMTTDEDDDLLVLRTKSMILNFVYTGLRNKVSYALE